MPFYSDPSKQLSNQMTMDTYSPWTQMLLMEQAGYPGEGRNPPPFVPVPVPVPVSEEEMRKRPPASSTTVDPLPRTDAELYKRLMKPYNKGWRHGADD